MTDIIAARRETMITAGYWRDRTLLDDFAVHATRTPEKVAVTAFRSEIGRETRLTYAELDRASTVVAARLSGLGVGRGDVVSFQLPNVWEAPVLHLACLKLGAISNPLMTILRERELRFMLRLAESRIFVVPAAFRGFDYPSMAHRLKPDLPDLAHVFVVEGDGPDSFDALLRSPTEAETTFVASPPAPDDVIQLLYTSGTTGEPKGVMHTSNTMLSNLFAFAERLKLNRDDVIHMPSPIGHQLGFMYGLVLPALLGASSVLQDIFDPGEMARQVIGEAASFTMGATPFLNDFVEHVETQGLTTPSLRTFVSAGAPIPGTLVSRASRVLLADVISAWGMSENGAVTTTRPRDSEALVTGSDGCALPGMEVKVVDHEGGTMPHGEAGELMVRGCSNFVGYFRRPELAGFDEDGWFDTGDIARMDENGYIRIAGRSKDIIIRGGENIPVVEIEGLLYRHEGVAAVAIVGQPHERLGETACAFVVPRRPEGFSFDIMIDYLKAQDVARQYLPERLELVTELPMTASGKVQKFVLRERLISENA